MERMELSTHIQIDDPPDSVTPGPSINEFSSLVLNWSSKKEAGVPIVNIYTGDVEDLERGSQLVFSDGKRRIDFILVWEAKESDKKFLAKQEARRNFEENLKHEGLEIEHDFQEGRTNQYTKIHAPVDVLTRYAELLKIRIPIKEVPEELPALGIWDTVTGFFSRVLDLFELDPDRVPKIPKRFSYVYERSKKYLFCCQDNEIYLFSHATRSRIVDYILRRKEYTKDGASRAEFGIKRLLADRSYLGAYPLHEGSWKKDSLMNIRKLLYDNWASWRCWYKIQPLNYVRIYFGEKIGLYFAWLGYYTYSLVLPSFIGLIVFLYGLISMGTDTISKESCNEQNNFTMCPLCNAFCSYWSMDQICYTIRATRLFDNGATVFFAIFMSLWATTYLEFWKREQAGIQFLWDLRNFEEEEEPPRPEYFVRISKSQHKKVNKKTGIEEPFFPFWRRQVPIYLTSCSVMLFLVVLAMAAVIGVIFYRISVTTAFYMTDNEMVFMHASLFVSVTAACINLVIIFILNFVYTKVAVALTDWECLKTQSEYDNSLTFKFYVLQFVNFYSSLFYIAFFKGRLGSQENYFTVYSGTQRQEECQGSCLTELCIQLAIIFVGKQLIQNTLMEIYMPRIKKWIKKKCFTSSESLYLLQKFKPWEKDYILEEMGSIGLFNEYLEMMIQFGFVTLFVAAFPLAPFFALINNIIELRSDANKFVTQFRRDIPNRAATIGIWFDILHSLSKFAILSNALIIAFTSSFIQRQLYIHMYSPSGTLEGFVNNSLSYFNVSDFPPMVAPLSNIIKPKYNDTVYCRYHDYREPPWSSNKYKYSAQHWNMVAAQFIFVMVFENVVILVVSLIAYLIPDVPRKLHQQMRQEIMLTQEIVLETELKRAKGGGGEILSEREIEGIRNKTDNVFNDVANFREVVTSSFDPENKGFVPEDATIE